MLHSFYFSPSGTTRETVYILSTALGMPQTDHDLTVKSDPLEVESEEDIVLLAAPVYAGRIPTYAAKRFSEVKGNGQRAIVIVVYGNRDYDDALLELCDIVEKQGFKVVSAGAFIGEHCIFPRVAAHRPDDKDREKINQFAGVLKDVLSGDGRLKLNRVKGVRPYKKISGVPLHPKVDKERCNVCGTCARECPTGAIKIDNPIIYDVSNCLTCCRCIRVCPQHARSLGGVLYKMAGWKFVKDNSRRREPEWFI